MLFRGTEVQLVKEPTGLKTSLSILGNKASMLRRCGSYLVKENHCGLGYFEREYLLVCRREFVKLNEKKAVVTIIPRPITAW